MWLRRGGGDQGDQPVKYFGRSRFPRLSLSPRLSGKRATQSDADGPLGGRHESGERLIKSEMGGEGGGGRIW